MTSGMYFYEQQIKYHQNKSYLLRHPSPKLGLISNIN